MLKKQIENITQSAAIKPTKICRYGENCYKKNPIHFSKFFHPHLEKILSKGIDTASKEYEIPDELLLQKDVVVAQLQILEKLFPALTINTKSENKSKNKVEISISSDDDADDENSSDYRNKNSFEKKEIQESKIAKSRSSPLPSSSAHTRKRSPTPSTSSSAVPAQTSDSSQLPKKQEITKNIHDYIRVVLPKGQMAKKLERAAPYNFFLTAITDSKPTHNEPLSITLQEIFDESLGEIESSVQINFIINIEWLLRHYYFAGCLDTPLLVLYGHDTPELRNISRHEPQVTAIRIQMSSPFATHHTKMMLLGYKDGSMRVVISTANLYENDWHNRTQGVWISPKLNRLQDDTNTNEGESITGFRNDLMLYLVEYKIPKLQPWIARIRKTDFSCINVFFIASVPGGFRDSVRGFPWGHARLGSLLGKHVAEVPKSSPIVAQSSSIGNLGINVRAWVMSDIGNSLRKDSAPLGFRRLPEFKMIYPSFGNVKNSHDGILGGGCLPYCKKFNDKQHWLKDYLYQWKANRRYRSQAMPHIKTYCRWSDDGLYWFVLTSANLSKAAWGAFNKNAKIEPTIRIMNYEAGVLFLPKFMIGEDTFPMEKERDGIPAFPMPYDVPLTPYGADDTPFLMDYLHDYLHDLSD